MSGSVGHMNDETPRGEGPAVPEETFPPCTTPQLLTIDDVGRVLRCSERTVYSLIDRGELQRVKLGPHRQSAVRVPRASLHAYLVRSGATDVATSQTEDAS